MSGLADVYQRRLIGLTIESRNFTFRTVKGSKVCREATENECCVEESGESGGSEQGSTIPEYTVETECSVSLMPEIMYMSFTYGSPVFTNVPIYWNTTSGWVGVPEGFQYCNMLCVLDGTYKWQVGVAHALSGSVEITDYVTPSDVSLFDLNYEFVGGGYAGGVVRITTVPQ